MSEHTEKRETLDEAYILELTSEIVNACSYAKQYKVNLQNTPPSIEQKVLDGLGVIVGIYDNLEPICKRWCELKTAEWPGFEDLLISFNTFNISAKGYLADLKKARNPIKAYLEQSGVTYNPESFENALCNGTIDPKTAEEIYLLVHFFDAVIHH